MFPTWSVWVICKKFVNVGVRRIHVLKKCSIKALESQGEIISLYHY